MAAAPVKSVIGHLYSMAGTGFTDLELVEQFLSAGDEAAFAALAHRHGPLVLGVCRRVLGVGPDVEDVFQATFVVLARKIRAIRKRRSVGSWLYGVAYHLAGYLGPVQARGQGDADALRGAEAGVLCLGGDTLQRAQRTGNEQEHGGPPKNGSSGGGRENPGRAGAALRAGQQDHFPTRSALPQIRCFAPSQSSAASSSLASPDIAQPAAKPAK